MTRKENIMAHRFFSWKWATLFCLTFILIFVAKLFAAEVPRISKEELQTMLDNPEVLIIDVRLSGDLADSNSKIRGAVCEDPRHVDSWMDKYPKDKTLVFYCA